MLLMDLTTSCVGFALSESGSSAAVWQGRSDGMEAFGYLLLDGNMDLACDTQNVIELTHTGNCTYSQNNLDIINTVDALGQLTSFTPSLLTP